MKYALIMGASGDIGTAIAKQLAKEGWSLYLHYYRSEEKIMALRDALYQKYPKQDFLTCRYDLRDSKHLDQLTNQLFSLDALIFASGHTTYDLVMDMTQEAMTDLYRVHLESPALLCGQLQHKLAQKSCGRVVFIGSIYGIVGSAMEVMYSAMKAGEQAFVSGYAKEVARLGITVNVVAPGAVDTTMNHHFDDLERATIESEIPLGRFAHPDEIATVVEFLCQETSQYITGATIPVSGGWLI